VAPPKGSIFFDCRFGGSHGAESGDAYCNQEAPVVGGERLPGHLSGKTGLDDSFRITC
jgi:hypothetical protein